MQDNVYCAEAQFLPRPKRYASEILEEDDGVIISSLIKGIVYFSDINHNLERDFNSSIIIRYLRKDNTFVFQTHTFC